MIRTKIFYTKNINYGSYPVLDEEKDCGYIEILNKNSAILSKINEHNSVCPIKIKNYEPCNNMFIVEYIGNFYLIKPSFIMRQKVNFMLKQGFMYKIYEWLINFFKTDLLKKFVTFLLGFIFGLIF